MESYYSIFEIMDYRVAESLFHFSVPTILIDKVAKTYKENTNGIDYRVFFPRTKIINGRSVFFDFYKKSWYKIPKKRGKNRIVEAYLAKEMPLNSSKHGFFLPVDAVKYDKTHRHLMLQKSNSYVIKYYDYSYNFIEEEIIVIKP
jgi:hypothetical protein